MTLQTISISVAVSNDQEARQVKVAMESIAKNFKPSELSLIAKKLELPLVKMKIRSML